MPRARKSDQLHAATLAGVRTTMGSQEAFEDLLREFLASSSALLAQMEAPARRPMDVELAAHTLKSMARLLGAQDLAEACRQLEFAAHGARAPAPPSRLLGQVRTETLRAQEEVRRLLA